MEWLRSQHCLVRLRPARRLGHWLAANPEETNMPSIGRHLPWLIIAIAGAFALGTIALGRGETISALWIVVAAVCVYLIA